MPDAGGKFRSAFYSISDEEYDRIFGDGCGCDDGPCDLCVEQDGKCQRGEDCRCRNGDVTEPGW